MTRATRFICLEEGELNYIKIEINCKLLKNVSALPSYKEYINTYGDIGFVEFKIIIENGHMNIENPESPPNLKCDLENHWYWNETRLEAWNDRVDTLTENSNWKKEILKFINPNSPEYSGLINTGCGDPNMLRIDRPDSQLTESIKKDIEAFDNDEYYR